VGVGEAIEEQVDFLFGEDGGKTFGLFRAQRVDGFVHGPSQDFAIEKEKGTEGLILGGGGHIRGSGQVGEEGLDFGDAHLGRVAFMVEEDIAPDPAQVAFFGAQGIVSSAQDVFSLFEQFWRVIGLHGSPLLACVHKVRYSEIEDKELR